MGVAYWFRFSGVLTEDMILTMFRQPIEAEPDGDKLSCMVRDVDISHAIKGTAERLGFSQVHFSTKSCRIGLVTGAGWNAGVDWDDAQAAETARMGGWNDARRMGATRKHYDLSKSVYRSIYTDIVLSTYLATQGIKGAIYRGCTSSVEGQEALLAHRARKVAAQGTSGAASDPGQTKS